MTHPLDAICEVIQEDVGRRGLRTDRAANLITATEGDFQNACRAIAKSTNPAIAIVTGFFIPHAEPPCGETDGPLGALFLARALIPLGMRIVLATDEFCIRALEVGLAECGLQTQVALVTLPSYEMAQRVGAAAYWKYFSELAGPLTFLIALERAGPSHTIHEVPGEHQDRCHTMGGKDITSHMSPAHWLFEEAEKQSPRVKTIGIGDGGNEIGMGKVSWEIIRRNIPGGGLVACRVPCDHVIVAGISNWGAYGLGAGVRWLCGRGDDADLFDRAREERLLRAMVDRGPLVDGVIGKATVTVDGLSFDQYSQILSKLSAIQ